MPTPDTPQTSLRAPAATSAGVLLSFMLASLVGLDGCKAIKGIFEVGFGVGAVVVIAIVVIVGGIIAMVRRK